MPGKNKTKMDSYASEFCMSAGDNALSRDKINASIVSNETANERQYVEALMDGLEDIGKKPTKNS